LSDKGISNDDTVILYGGLGAAIFMLPFSMIRAHHYSSIAAGLAKHLKMPGLSNWDPPSADSRSRAA